MTQGLNKLSYHAGLYVIADIMQRRIAFLLIPLYTLFLTPADYGILSVTTAFSGALSVFPPSPWRAHSTDSAKILKRSTNDNALMAPIGFF